MARSQVAIFLKQEALLLGMNDAFLLGAFVFALLAAFIWFASTVGTSYIRWRPSLSLSR